MIKRIAILEHLSGSSHIIIHLSVLKAFLIAIVVPDVETLGPWARKKGLEGSFEELCRNKVRLAAVWFIPDPLPSIQPPSEPSNTAGVLSPPLS